MLKFLSPASWTLIFLMLLVSLYIQAHKISRQHRQQTAPIMGASFNGR